MGLQILARQSGNVTILDMRGRIVIGASNDSFEAQLRKLAESRPCAVLLNLAEVTQMDSSGISTMVRSYISLTRDGGSLKILNPTGHVHELLKITHLDNSLPIFTDEAHALASFCSAAHA